MIDVKVTTLGGPEIAAKLAEANSQLRAVLRMELRDIGSEIVAEAQPRAPRRTGIMASKIRWYFGSETMRGPKGGAKHLALQDTKWKDGRIVMTVRPFGRVAHLMERGVNATFQQRAGRGHRAGHLAAGITASRWQHAKSLTYERTLRIAPRPFFTLAVTAVGGAAGVNARLQGRLDTLAGDLQGGE